jgi:guanylate kinase
MESRGKFILVIGPTGSGKSVLLSHIQESFPELVFTTSYTTREMRPGHENANYKFLTKTEFENRIAVGEFLEWAQYGANYYGTPRDEVRKALDAGKTLIKEMEVQGVRQMQENMPNDLVLIYIHAGSWDELERRVRARAPISEEELQKRKKRYEDEFPFKDIADVVIDNPPGKVEEAKAAFNAAIAAIIKDSTNHGVPTRA